MKIDFGQFGIRELVHVVGSLNYLELVSLASAHGIEPLDTFNQLKAAVESGSVRTWESLGKPTLYQRPTGRRAARVEVDDKEVDSARAYVLRAYKEKAFRAGTLAKDLNEGGYRRYDGDTELLWDKDYAGAALKVLTKEGVVLAGEAGPQGIWYKLPNMKKPVK